MNPLLAGDPLSAMGEMLSQPFMRYAFVAGTATALSAGLVSYFLVLRSQVFSGDALGHVAFTGALAALAFGADLRLGLFAATVAGGLVLAALGRRARTDDVVIGSFFAWILGLGVLFLSIFTTSQSAANSAGGIRVLFGSILGLDANLTWLAVIVSAGVCVAFVVIARPLLFASIDESVAEARGVPVRLLGYAFLAVVGFAAAEATQAVGALLILGLLAAPGGIAQRLTDRPFLGMAISPLIAIASLWAGLTVSYFVPRWPPSFSILLLASLAYLATSVAESLRQRRVTGDVRAAAALR